MTVHDKLIGTTGHKPRQIADVAELPDAIAALRGANQRIGLVPTMGALHAGHLSLVRASQQECDVTVVTIFVNPTQFAPHEDLEKYPRTRDDDLASLSKCNVDLVFEPSPQEMYPPGFSTYVEPPLVAAPLEGQWRPGHFRGVATVVLKLFQLIPAAVAYFGQKDYQQYLVIRNMVRDLNLPLAIGMCPTVREPDGLAMSSRNRYLRAEHRRQAVGISRSLFHAQQLVAGGQRDAAVIIEQMRHTLADAGVTRVDYAAIADCDTLNAVHRVEKQAVALLAAYVGNTRLIDNCLLGEVAVVPG